MAIDPRDSPITREVVYRWLQDYKRATNLPSFTKTKEEFLAGKLESLGLENEMVNTVGHESLGDETTLLDMILMDLESYG